MSDQSLLSSSLFRAASAGTPDEILALLPSLVDRATASGQREVAAILAAYIERLALARSWPWLDHSLGDLSTLRGRGFSVQGFPFARLACQRDVSIQKCKHHPFALIMWHNGQHACRRH